MVRPKFELTKLKKVLGSKETKEKILEYLRDEFIKYGSEIVEGALTSMYIEIRDAEPPGIEKKSAKGGPKGNTLTDRVLNLIQISHDGISKKEICNKLSLSGKQASNVIYKLKKWGQIKSDSPGVFIATHKPPIKKPKTISSKSPGKTGSIREKVLKAVERYKKGATTDQIIGKTGLEKKQIKNALHALKKKEKIISVDRDLFKAV